MPQKIILVRHGETQDNKERRFQGWKNTPLNTMGHEQAKKVAARFAHEKIDAIYSSDLQRALETADHIAETLHMQVIPDFALREHDMGIFTGWQREIEKDPVREQMWETMQAARTQKNIHWKGHGGESLADQSERVHAFLKKLDIIHQESVVMLVVHGGSMNRVVEYFRFKEIDEYRSYKNTAVSIIEKVDGVYKLKLDNDISHL